MMNRSALVVTLFVAGSAEAISDTTRCKVGLTLSGLGAELSGDYIGDGNSFTRFLNHSEMNIGFTWTDPDHPQHTPYGCDFWTCSAEDTKLANGKWGIIARTNFASLHYTLLAVCDEGCPDVKPSCADIYNQQNCTEGHTADSCLHCPVWPAAWNSTMKWRILNTTMGVPSQARPAFPSPPAVTADAYCCKRKPMECDACAQDTCPGLIGLFHNNCPPNGGDVGHSQSKLQKDCCDQHESVAGFPVCACGLVPTECDHPTDRLVV